MNLMMIPCYGLLELLDLTEMNVIDNIGYRQNLWMENSLRNMGNDNDADDKKNVIKL